MRSAPTATGAALPVGSLPMHPRGPPDIWQTQRTSGRSSPAFWPGLAQHVLYLTADIEVPQGGGEGMIVEDGGRFGGYDERKTRAERKAQDRTGPGHNSEGLRVQGDGGAR